MTTVKRMMALFSGLDRAYGIYRISNQAVAGAKKKGDARTLQQPVTEELWAQHLAGEIQIGIIPIRDDAACWFAAIDIDDYKLDHVALGKKIEKLKLPLIICRSKSGGGHLYAFFEVLSLAAAVRELMSGWAASLGYSNVEIFPKQDQLHSQQDTGNWINMPYCGGDNSERYAIHKGKQLTLEQFLTLAERSKIKASIFDSTDEFPELLEEGPPCLITLANQGLPEGTRNNGLFNLGVYCRKRWPDDWEVKLEEMNQNFISPPLDSGEMKQITDHLSKKTYNYRCKDVPIVNVCQHKVCLNRKYGVKGDEAQQIFGPQLENVTRLEVDPPMYFADFQGKRITFGADELTSQQHFRRTLIKQANVQLMQLTQVRWQRWVDNVLQLAVIVEAPQETSKDQLVLDCLEEYCLELWPAKSWDDVIDGGAYDDGTRTHFRPHKFIQSVNKEHRQRLTSSEVYLILRHINVKDERRKIRRKTYALWSVPSFERPEHTNADEL